MHRFISETHRPSAQIAPGQTGCPIAPQVPASPVIAVSDAEPSEAEPSTAPASAIAPSVGAAVSPAGASAASPGGVTATSAATAAASSLGSGALLSASGGGCEVMGSSLPQPAVNRIELNTTVRSE